MFALELQSALRVSLCAEAGAAKVHCLYYYLISAWPAMREAGPNFHPEKLQFMSFGFDWTPRVYPAYVRQAGSSFCESKASTSSWALLEIPLSLLMSVEMHACMSSPQVLTRWQLLALFSTEGGTSP